MITYLFFWDNRYRKLMPEQPIHNNPPEFLFPQPVIDAVSHPRVMFQRVQKRDGSLVDFDKQEITDCIWEAARSVGGKDYPLADHTADLVILYMARNYEDSILNVEQIEDAVEKVLIENGHAQTSKSFILMRENRARLRKMRGPVDALPNVDSSQDKTQVRVQRADQTLKAWNRQKIVDALVRETGLNKETADIIAKEVESQVVMARLPMVTVGIIRELVNARLLHHGLIEEHRKHIRLGLPVFDLEQYYKGYTRPGGDSAVAGRMSRKYALNTLYSADVVEARTQGQIHLYGLDSLMKWVSGIIPLDKIKNNGLTLPGKGLYFKPAATLSDLLNQFSCFGITAVKCFGDEVHWTALNQILSSYYSEENPDLMEQELHSFLERLESGSQETSQIIHLVLSSKGSSMEVQLASKIIHWIALGDDTGRPYPNIQLNLQIPVNFTEHPEWPVFRASMDELIAEERPFLLNIYKHPLHPECPCVSMKVSLNSIQAALESEGNTEIFYSLIQRQIRMAFRAFEAKNNFMNEIISHNPDNPLSMMASLLEMSPNSKTSRPCLRLGISLLNRTVNQLNSTGDLSLEGQLQSGLSILNQLNNLLHQEVWKTGIEAQLFEETNPIISDRFLQTAGVDYIPGSDLNGLQMGPPLSIDTTDSLLQLSSLQKALNGPAGVPIPFKLLKVMLDKHSINVPITLIIR